MTVVLAMLLAVSLCVPAQAAYANPLEDAGNAIASFFGLGDTRAAGDSEKFADASTANAHEGLLGDEDSTQYAGRVWTDKTVFSGDATFAGDTGSPTVTNDSDFLVSYSALSTSTSVMGQTQAPIDVVFVIDLSGSMSNDDSNMDNGRSRIANTVDAVNASIDKLMELNEHTRIAVVGFSNTATTLLPLDHYSKMNNNNYLSLNRTEGSDWWPTTLTYQAVGSNGNRINDDISVSGGTNTQVGMYQGMDLLESASSTTVDINGTTVNRIPSVILLSDGASTFSSNSESWWAPANNNRNGSGSDSYAGNGMKLMMTASYMKQAIDGHYNVTEDAYKTTVYTIGMGITELNGDDQDLAEVSLNPTAHLNNNNDMANTIRAAWEAYKNGGEPTIRVGNNQNRPRDYTITHPQQNDIDSIEYVNEYYDADNAEQVTEVFDDIVNNISVSRPSAPTKVEGGDYDGDGYITYTDPIGEYMEVKDFKEIICGEQRFTQKSTTQIQGGTRYVFEGSLTSDVYGEQALSNIYVDVLTDASGNQTVKIDIPAASIPLRINTVTLNDDGTVQSNTNNGADPIRFLYTVGFRSDVLTDGKVDLDKISNEYKTAHVSEDGTSVNFYSNKYTGTNMYNDQTAGDAYVEYTPATNNPFYYIQNNIPLTVNGQPATGDFDMNADYTFSVEYYEGTEKKTAEYTRKGSELAQEVGGVLEGVTQNSDGVWCIAAGTPRLANLSQFNVPKTNSPTQSADLAHYPTFVGQSVATGNFKTYLGNNGRLSVELPGSLSVSKTIEVEQGSGLTIDTNKEFTFTLNLDRGENGAAYPAQKYNADGEPVGEAFTVANGGTFTLKHGETLKVTGLSGGMTYDVIETEENGYTPTAASTENKSGTITAGSESSVAYVNEYTVNPAPLDGSTYLKYQKQLKMEDGTDAWAQNPGIEFEFHLTAASYTGPANISPTSDSFPMPDVTGTTVEGNRYLAATVTNGDVVHFGEIAFDKPGVYTYLIYEKTPAQAGQAVGVSYSGMVYRVIVTVEDNKDGTLSVSSEMKRTFDQGGQLIPEDKWETITDNTAVILNEFDLASTYVDPVGTKVYNDTTNGGNPLVANMFTFKIKPVTQDAPVPLGDGDAPLNPDANGAYTSTNALDGSVVFGHMKFEENHVGKTYVYEIWEDGSAAVSGMAYDQNHYYVHVAVSNASTPEGDAVVATMTYKTGPNATDSEILDSEGNPVTGLTFNNTYDPEDAVADISVSKVVSGRYWLENESFTFHLTPVNGAPLPQKDGATNAEVELTTAVPATAPGVGVFDTFGDVTFDKVGTYVYKVTEESGGMASNGLVYDGMTSTVTITVTDDKAGKLNASVAYSNDYNNTDSASTFHNVYTASTTMAGVDVSKVLNGRSMAEGEFTFTITGVDSADDAQDASYVSGADAENKVGLTDANRTFKNTRSANGVPAVMTTPLNNIKFTQADAGKTFAYSVDEVTGTANGVTYDENSYLVTIEVVDSGNGTMNTITKVVRESDNKEISTSNNPANRVMVPFVNTYAPTSLEFDTANIEFNKLVTGRDWLDDPAESFTFSIAATNVENAPGLTVENMPKPENATATITNADGNKVDGTPYAVSGFGKITFTQPGIYTYTITENMPAGATDGVLNGMTYDRGSCTVQIRVTDNLDGTMTAVVTPVSDPVFENVYAADVSFDDAFNFAVTKQLNGHAMTENQFEFKMEAIDGPVATDAKAAETAAKLGLADGEVAKTFNGPAAETADGAVATVLSGLSDDMEFTQADSGKTFSVKFSETSGNAAGYTYDKAAYRLDITPSDNEATGAMTLTVKVTKSVPDQADVVTEYTWTEGSTPVVVTLPFVNNYATSGTLDGATALKVSKNLIGRDWAVDGETFGFQIEKVSYKENDQATEKTDDATLAAMPAPAELTIQVGKDGGSFGNITFTQPGIYTYKVSEVVPAESEPGMSYSPVTYTVSVKATDEAGNGTLKLETSYSPELAQGENAVMSFINSYQEKTVSGTSGTNGAAQVGDELTYTIKYANTEAVPATVTITDTVPAGTEFVKANGGDSIALTARNLTWVVNNVEPGTGGEVTMVVRVTEDAVVETIENQAEVKVGDHDPNVTTKVDTPLAKDGALTISKTVAVEGDQGLDVAAIQENSAFTFQVALKNAAGNDLAGTYSYKGTGVADGTIANNGTIKLKHGQSITIEGLPAGATYTVTEAAVEGYTQTAPADAKPATGAIVAEQTAAAAFTNHYKVDDVTLTGDTALAIQKTFTGRNWLDTDTFDFTVTKVSYNNGTDDTAKANMPDISGTTIGKPADGGEANSVKLADVTFTKAGTYVYEIAETKGDLGGVTYDENTVTVTITVTDNGKGKLEASVKYGDNDDATAAAFTNTYGSVVPGDKPISTDDLFTKVFTGREWKAEDNFTFKIEAVTEGAPMPASGEVTINGETADPNAEKAGTQFGFGSISFTFDDIKDVTPNTDGTRTKDFQYRVYEVEGTIAGVKYDTHEALLTITVTDNGKGQMSGTSAITAVTRADNSVFTNVYNSSLDYVAAGGLKITKTLDGRAMANEQFGFTVTPEDEASAEKIGLTMDGTVVKAPAAEDGKAATIDLLANKKLVFTQDDAGKTYSYTIEETLKGGAGYTNDEAVRTVTIAVADNGNATLTVTTTVAGGPDGEKVFTYTTNQPPAAAAVVPFENSYYAETGDDEATGAAVVKTTKTLNGRDLTADEFNFEIRPQAGGDVVATATNDANGNVVFTPMTYNTKTLGTPNGTKDGKPYWELKYTASEVTTGLPGGVSATTRSFDFTVTVVDNGDGTLTATPALPEGNSFVNTYSTGDPVPMDLKGSKVLDAADGLTPGSISGKFTFTVVAENGGPLPANTTATNDANGNVDFGQIKFTLDDLNKALGTTTTEATDATIDGEESNDATALDAETRVGTLRSFDFVYTITESGTAAGVTNDTGTKTVTFRVTDDGAGDLTVERLGDATTAFTFTNTYSVVPTDSSVTDQITITKELDGRDMVDGEFTFELVETIDGKEAVVATGANAAGGTVTFDSIKYAEPGEHDYLVREVNDGKGGVTYDTKAYSIHTSVTDNGDGTLSVKHAVVDGDAIGFMNSYEPVAAAVTFGATKVLEGTGLKDGQFTFELRDSKGEVLYTAKNDATGQVLFPIVEFAEAGTYKYTIAEKNDGQEGVTYDTTQYEATVTVADDGQGHLSASAAYANGKDPVFSNTYTEPENPSEPGGGKPGDPEPPALPDTSDTFGPLVIGLGALAVIACAGLVVGAIKMRRKSGSHHMK